MIQISEVLNGNLTEQDMEPLFILHAELERLKKNKEDSNDTIMTVGELQENYSSINWTEYLRGKTLGIANITDSLKVYVEDPDYVRDVISIMIETDPLTISLLQTAMALVEITESSATIKKDKSSFSRDIPMPRWRKCLEDLRDEMGIAMSYLYVKDNGNSKTKKFTEEMLLKLKQIFYEMLQKSNIYDKETMRRIDAKMGTLLIQVGYSDVLKNVTLIEEYYKELNFTKLSYLESLLEVSKFNYRVRVREFIKESTGKRPHPNLVNVVHANAHYSPLFNSVRIPAAFISNALMALDAPPFINYGGLGVILAHELGHMLQVTGKQTDHLGNRATLFTDGVAQRNKERVQCMADHFSKFTDKRTRLRVSNDIRFLY